ncbi:unnamed protein product [Nezara viridula]|uniref:Uncharacterized protein n=1 Tax=Nezara viridula TaxID=85310 RepID=A0A9P0HIA9_NEZVI|nr:unnamed protein product [Nezara viridula]
MGALEGQRTDAEILKTIANNWKALQRSQEPAGCKVWSDKTAEGEAIKVSITISGMACSDISLRKKTCLLLDIAKNRH